MAVNIDTEVLLDVAPCRLVYIGNDVAEESAVSFFGVPRRWSEF